MGILNCFFDMDGDDVVEPVVEVNKNDDCLPIYTTLNFPDELNLPRPQIANMTEEEFEVFAEKLRIFFLDKYEKERTPAISGENTLEIIIDRLKKINKLDITDPKVYFEENGNKILKAYNTWGSVVNHWFPEMMDVEITSGIESVKYSIVGFFRESNPRYQHIMKRILWRDALNGWKKRPDEPLWPIFRQSIRMGCQTQPVVNIRVAAAKWIYEANLLREKDRNELIVYDPSMGWGGRLVAFLAATSNPELRQKRCVYIGTDPNSAITERYHMVTKFWKKYIDPECNAEVYPICCGSEDFHKTEEFKRFKGRGCLGYTSPPYFNRERYSDDPEQSFRKYSTYERWRDGFLKDTFQNAYDFLDDGGQFFWNIANIKISTKKVLPLEKDSCRIAEQVGFEYNDLIHMLMKYTIGRDEKKNFEKIKKSGMMNLVECEGKFQKYEPVFVYKK
jgi:hypothetical protein